MKYHFQVDLNVYKLFVDKEDYDKEYVKSLEAKYDCFTIRYDDSPKDHNLLDTLNAIEGYSDHYQILLIGVKDNAEHVLAYWYIGDDNEDELYIEGKKAFKKMLKYVIGEY